MPNLAVASTRESEQYMLSGANGIDVAVVTDTTGREFDVNVSDTPKGKKQLLGRANSSAALLRAKEPAGLGFALERTVAFQSGEHAKAPTGTTAVLITVHNDGLATPLDQLTESQCVSVGTAIGAIHRLRPAFLEKEGYPSYTAAQIRQQLVAWIARLKESGHVPDEITDSWEHIVDTEGLWSFHTCPVHGGFEDGDMLFSSTGLNAIYHWNNMQVNDPARDLAWIFAKLDAKRRNSVLSAYARLIGSRLDDLIMLRASLWLQMEQVGEFIQALDRADNDKIIEFKAHVERLAHQLSVRTAKAAAPRSEAADGKRPSTITVGTLLEKDDDGDSRRPDATTAHAAAPRRNPAPMRGHATPDAIRSTTATTRPADSVGTGPESRTAVVQTPDANSDNTATVSLPALRPEDFDDPKAGRPDDGKAGNTDETKDADPSSDTAATGAVTIGGKPSEYISLVDENKTDKAHAPTDATDPEPESESDAKSEEPAETSGDDDKTR
ncbi:phosphotransferase [Bifidobacterium sp. SMB2]|uniref:Phosphotransferase n=2 Tax=Bifidobacterium TaxID=1678 RepID=A0ABX0CH50_9BIFI|nr:phosphotransferase [Bifidobacterium sp. SMB2]NEG95903.1 phosphotransferase [Bifidobacterium sp. SMB2]NEH11750.1 phosphotransferase [Bifidobacterium saimiriisciurei]